MVEVLHYEAVNKNKTIGYVDVRVPITKPTVLIFRKVAHVQSGDRRWFSLPTFTRDKETDHHHYLKFCEFETQVHNGSLLESLAEKVKQFCEENGITTVESMEFDKFPDSDGNETPFN